jgi:hypothetical protein
VERENFCGRDRGEFLLSVCASQDIGTWQGVFSFVATVSVITNSALIMFSTDAFSTKSVSNVWLFVMLQVCSSTVPLHAECMRTQIILGIFVSLSSVAARRDLREEWHMFGLIRALRDRRASLARCG